MKTKILISIVYSSILFIIGGCSSLISSYDQYSYTQTTSLKIDALNLMNEANEDYKLHETEAKWVILNIQKLMEYEKHLPKNTITMNQWVLLSDTNGNLFGGFLKEWKVKHILKPAFITNKQEQVSRGFDAIIKLETSKIHY